MRATTGSWTGPAVLAATRTSVADLADIIVSKEAADRDKDREALPELRALQAARLARAAYPEGIDAAVGQRDAPSPPVEGPGRGPDHGREHPGRTLA